MATESKVTEIFCISDDYHKEYALEWNKKTLFQLPFPIAQSVIREGGEWAMWGWLPSLSCFAAIRSEISSIFIASMLGKNCILL